MKKTIKNPKTEICKLVVGCFLSVSYSSWAMASSTTQQVDFSAEAKAIKEQMAQLQQQMIALEKRQQQLLSLANDQSKQKKGKSASENNSDKQIVYTEAPSAKENSGKSPQVLKQNLPEDKVVTKRDFEENEEEINDFETMPYGDTLLANIGGTAVITSPFIQSRYDFRGSNLITNYSAVNKDVAALYQRRDFARQMTKFGLDMPNFPIIALSGQLKGAIVNGRLFSGQNVNDIDLLTAELDVEAMVNSDFTGFMSFLYDNSPPIIGPRVNNSRLALDNGFITWGNFEKTNFYATLGQVYVPFGQYTTYLISDPFNKVMFRTKARALVLGYESMDEEGAGPYASIFGFRGETREGKFISDATQRSPNRHINTFGANLGYAFEQGDWQGDFAIAVINNVADSRGMQATGASSSRFEGFASSSVTEVIQRRVPGIDVRGLLAWKAISLIGEYTSATRAFSPFDLSFNGKGARPDSYHLESAYTFNLLENPSTFALAYDHSDEALGLNIPKRRYAAVLSSAIWPNTLASLEYNFAVNYKANDTASGGDGPIFNRPGKISNAIIANFDVYF